MTFNKNTGLHITDLIDSTTLQKVQDEFSKFSGMAALTTDNRGTPVTHGSGFTDFCMKYTRQSEVGCERCENCDLMGAINTQENGKVCVYTCHAGLVDFAAPILVNGHLIGSFIGGQVLKAPIDEEKVREIARNLDIDEDEYLAASKKVNIISEEEINKNANFLGTLANILSQFAYTTYSKLNNNEVNSNGRMKYVLDSNLETIERLKKSLENVEAVLKSDNIELHEKKLRELNHDGSKIIRALSETVDYINMTKDEVDVVETVYNIRDMISYCWRKTCEIDGDGGNEFVLEIADDVPENLFGAYGQFVNIIKKLLHNAIYFCKNGVIRFEVSQKVNEYSTDIKISITDTGNGIRPDDLIKIQNSLSFDEYRMENERDEINFSFHLIGIMCRQISGNIEVESELGKYTKFTLNFPQLEVRL